MTSTPEKPRPSLDDTIARIDAALAERAPGSGPTIAEINDVREPLGLPRLELDAQPPPPGPAELRAIAADLNAHGGYDERFVAALLEQAAPRGWLARTLRRLFT